MYQAISYNYYDKTCTIRDDEKGWVNFPYTPTYYKVDSEGEYKDRVFDGRSNLGLKK